jgi:hypothetical protein
MVIARMNLDDIPSLSRVVRNMAHITREMEAGHTGKQRGGSRSSQRRKSS